MPLSRYLSPLSSDKYEEEERDCNPFKCPSECCVDTGCLYEGLRTRMFETSKPPNIEHELDVVKSLVQRGSSISGNNLFDHLADIIKRVVDGRPTNIIDYFEEFSYNIREQKFRIPERFSQTHYDLISAEKAKSFLTSMKLPAQPADNEYNVCKKEKSTTAKRLFKSNATFAISSLSFEKFQRKLLPNENVTRLHLYWALCGFGLLSDEVLHLSYALQKIQFQPTVKHARFWGKIYGLRKSYYIVEVILTQSEMEIRLNKMRKEMMDKMSTFRNTSEQSMSAGMDLDLIPGVHWQDQTKDDILRIPKRNVKVFFDVPPEPVGTGLNRRTYFVLTSLNEDWVELPIATPKQIEISRNIKKYLTGDLEADLVSYPKFPGNEKHYLRAMIARITSGTYIAPSGYYRRLTQKERMETEEVDEEDLEFDAEEGDEDFDNDAIIVENSEYKPNPRWLMTPKSWVHVRPNILEQGRVVYFDEEEARIALAREGMLEEELDDLEDELDEEDVLVEEDDEVGLNSRPVLFSACGNDSNVECSEPWSPRYSSVHNKTNQLIIMRSNLWPGAYSFAFEGYCDSIYLGWGFKYNTRNMTIPQIAPIQDDYYPGDVEETSDPTVEMEDKWRLFQINKQVQVEEYESEEEFDSY